MQVTFHGAAREVTGSMHLLSSGNDRILLDCGMFQGRRKESAKKNRRRLIEPDEITNIVLSHAHIDHSGRIPLMTRRDFKGRIICTRATADACHYLLQDAAYIQESDANYLNYKMVRKAIQNKEALPDGTRISGSDGRQIKRYLKTGKNRLNVQAINEVVQQYGLPGIEPLYTAADAENALDLFDGYPYRHPVTVGRNIRCTFYDAGHILGSAVAILRHEENGRRKTVCFSGDLGRFETPIIRNPTLQFAPEDTEIDLLIMESTYGNRSHGPVNNLKPGLQQAIIETIERNGTVLIPAFAFGRTQNLIYILHELYQEGAVPRVPVSVDSPLAVNLTRVYGEHPEVYDQETGETFLENGRNPFMFDQVHFIQSVDDSMALMRQRGPNIIIASSGMCEAGRILHHLRNKIHDPNSMILVVGFMAQHTLGRKIADIGTQYAAEDRKGKAPMVKILNKEYPLKAKVQRLDGFSAHADKDELLRFLNESNLKVKKIAIVHGEEEQSLAFAETLRAAGRDVVVPEPGQTVEV